MKVSQWAQRALPCALVVAGARAGAQLSSAVSVGATMQRQSASSWQTATALQSAMRWDQRWVQLGVDGMAITSGAATRLDHADLDLLVAPPTIGPFRWSAATHVERVAPLSMSPRTALTSEAMFSAKFGASGVWIGAGAERRMAIADAHTAPLASVGAWHQVSSVLVAVRATSHDMRTTEIERSTVPKDSSGGTREVSTPTSRVRRWSDVELRGMWTRGRIALDAAAGARPASDGSPRTQWANARANIELSSRLSLTTAAGTEPSRIALSLPSTRFARIGLRVAPAALSPTRAPTAVRASPSAFSVRPSDAGSYVIAIRVPHARVVELSGDFNAWTPIQLQHTHGDAWEVSVPLAPGTYHMNVRVDGDRWTAPPGTTAVTDDFNGTVGLVVVR